MRLQKAVAPDEKGSLVTHVVKVHGVSHHQACKAVRLPRSTQQYKLDQWCKNHQITLAFIQPGRPMQNGYVERCNGNIRKELLNAYVFTTLQEVRQKKEQWRQDYNCSRPHQALGFVPPAEYI